MIDIDFKFYLSIFWRRLPLFLLIWLVVTSIGVAIAYLLPSIYKSEARFLVESAQINPEFTDSTAASPAEEIIQRIQARIMTRTNLLDIEQRFNALGRWPGYSPTERVDLMKKSIMFEVLDLGGGRRGENATAFTVAFFSESAQTTVNITNDLVTQILEQNVEITGGQATDTREFLERQVNELSKTLADLEAQIVYFKNENVDALPESLEFRRNEMSRIQTRLQQIDSQELTLLDQKAALQRLIDNPNLLLEATPTARRSAEEIELVRIKRQRASRLGVLSATHPEIQALDREIVALEQIVRETAVGSDGNDSGSALGETRVSLRAVETNLEFLDTQRKDLEASLSRLAKSIEQTPNVEMQLNILERKQLQLQTQFDEQLSKLNKATTGEIIVTEGKGERFEVIEQPSYPDEPIKPNRILIALGSVIGGIGLAAGFIFLLELLNNSVRRPVELVNRLGIQPFAVVPYIPTRAEIIRSRFRTVLSIVGVAIFVPTALYLIHYHYMPIDLIIANMAERFGIDSLALMFS